MTTFDAIKNIAASGMAAQRLRVQLAATNIANVETTRSHSTGIRCWRILGRMQMRPRT